MQVGTRRARAAEWRGKLVKTGMVAVALAAAVSCGGAAPAPTNAQLASVQAGDMPEGGDWTGVYYSPTFGYLHLVKQGTSASGRWKTANGKAWGELNGTVTGDLLRFSWTEYKIGMVGAGSETSGHGYFRYVAASGDSANDTLDGEWGLGQSDSGYPWDAVKQRNVMPDPDSVVPPRGDVIQGTGGWE